MPLDLEYINFHCSSWYEEVPSLTHIIELAIYNIALCIIHVVSDFCAKGGCCLPIAS